MATDESTPLAALHEAARILSAGGDLDERLARLCAEARRVAASELTMIYLLDADARVLVPAGGDLQTPSEPPVPGGSVDADALIVSFDDATDPIARAARERRREATSPAPPALASVHGSVAFVECVPLVAEDSRGSQEVHGVLVNGFVQPSEGGRETDAETLLALARIAAVIIRDFRLERAMLERSDWFDRIASVDPLTGLANREIFERSLQLELDRAARQATPVSLALFDVDGLDAMTREAGADVGDEVLRQVASVLAETVRVVDTVGRLGADEFGAIAPGSAGGTAARRVRDAVQRVEPPLGAPITVSSGVARFPDDGKTVEELISAARRALEEAKGQGRGAVVSTVGD